MTTKLTCQIFLPLLEHFQGWCKHLRNLGQVEQPEMKLNRIYKKVLEFYDIISCNSLLYTIYALITYCTKGGPYNSFLRQQTWYIIHGLA